MDPIAHTLVGAAAAQTGLGRRSAYATAALVIGANLPDIDGVAMFLSGDSSLYWRRGWTHGILANVLLPLLLTALLIAWSRAFGRPPPRPCVLLGLSYLAVWSHPSLDWLNTYGVRWLMPFDGTWFYGDTLFVVDPWFWLILAGAAFLFRSRHQSRSVDALRGIFRLPLVWQCSGARARESDLVCRDSRAHRSTREAGRL